MPHKNCIDFNQADCGQLETSDGFTLTQYFWVNQSTNAWQMSSSFWQMSPMSRKIKGSIIHRDIWSVRTEQGDPMWYLDWVNFVLLRHLYEISAPERLTAYTWHFPYHAAIWLAQTSALLSLNFFFASATHWVTTDYAVRKIVGFVHCWVGPYVWRHHLDIFWGLHQSRSEG